MQRLDRSLLSIKGAAWQLLQPIITNDLALCQASQAIYSLLLNAQGRYLFDFFVYYLAADQYIIDVLPAQLQLLLAKLNLYKLRTKVVIEDITEQYCVYYGSEQQLSLLEPLVLSQDPRYKHLKFRAVSKVKNHLSAVSSQYLLDKYRYAIPEGGFELQQERSLAPEWGMQELNALSYNKGCYIGQEVVARAKYLGVVRKKVYQVEVRSGVVLPPNGNIYSGATNIGTLYSSLGSLGIALIRDGVHAEPTIAQIPLELKIAPWYG